MLRLITIVLCIVPAVSWAQTVPQITIGAGAGPMQFQGRRITFGAGSVQIGLRPNLALELELGRWVERDAPGFQFDGQRMFEVRRREVTLPGANLLFRAGIGRVTGFAGGGLSVHVIRERFDRPVSPTGEPIPGEGSAVSSSELGLQTVGGVDVAITPRFHGFIGLRGEILPEPNLGLNAGMRFVVRSRTAARERPAVGKPHDKAADAVGRTVRITRLNGQKVSGKLVSLDDTEVVIDRDGRPERISLNGVRLVERPAHWARNLALVSGAFWGGALLTYCLDDCSGEGVATIGLTGAAITGAAAGVGAMINAATSDRRTLYRR